MFFTLKNKIRIILRKIRRNNLVLLQKMVQVKALLFWEIFLEIKTPELLHLPILEESHLGMVLGLRLQPLHLLNQLYVLQLHIG